VTPLFHFNGAAATLDSLDEQTSVFTTMRCSLPFVYVKPGGSAFETAVAPRISPSAMYPLVSLEEDSNEK